MIERLVGLVGELAGRIGLPTLGGLQSGLQAVMAPEVLDRTGAALVGVMVIACLFVMPRA